VTGLPTISIKQPYPALIFAGIKTLETRTGPPAGDMRPPGVRPEPGLTVNRGDWVGIHAGAQWAPGWCRWYDDGDPLLDALVTAHADVYEDVNGSHSWKVDRRSLPLGVLLGVAQVVDAVPIGLHQGDHVRPCIGGELWLYRGGEATDISDQLPYGIFTPGRWALLLANPTPTTVRCPWCLGPENNAIEESQCPVSQRDDGQHCNHAMTHDVCHWCNVEWLGDGEWFCPACEGVGHCPPIPAIGKLGFWRWTP